VTTIEVTFKIARADQWVPIEQCLDDISGTVENNLEDCCAFEGGFFIDIGGLPWSGDGTVGDFGMTASWLHALKLIWDGSGRASVWAWEESRLTLIRNESLLEMEDVHITGLVAMPKVVVPLAEFTAHIVREGEKFAMLVRRLQAELVRRQRSENSFEDEQKLQQLASSLPSDINQVLEYLEIKLAGHLNENNKG
jgi:hypothetical protein